MATKAEEHFMDWLRDAHAMEEHAERMLGTTASRMKNYPAFKARLEQHQQQTRQQASLIKGCIERRGGSTSTVKDLAGKVAATAQGLSGLFVSDEVVKALLGSYTFAQFEIASYRSLIAAAQTVGDVETQRVCQQILADEEALAGWLGEQIPLATQEFLARAAVPGTTAKH